MAHRRSTADTSPGERNRANMVERGLIPLPQSGRCCLDGWKKDLIWKPNQCLSDCKPAVSANSPTGSCALYSAESVFGESKSCSNWFTELSRNPQRDQSTSYIWYRQSRTSRMPLRGGLKYEF